MGKTCCFTGHRPKSLPFGSREDAAGCIRMKALLTESAEREIVEEGVTHFISGMAMGVDIYAAETVLKLKEKYPQVTLECAIPCAAQTARWPESWQKRYFDILAVCDKETLLQTAYTADCMIRRNRYMVDSSDVVIAVWNGTKSGTGNTVCYAQEKNKKVLFLNPNDWK